MKAVETKEITNEEAQIRALADEWAAAVSRKDFDAIMAHYAEDVVVFDVPPPLQIKGREAFRKTLENWLGSFKSEVVCERRDVRITVGGDAAFLHCLARISDKPEDGTASGSWVRVTVCYQKIDGRWLVTHEHASLPFNGQTGESPVDLKS